MKSAPLPPNEFDRLKALADYQILDTPPEETYDAITRIASELTGTPIALLTLVDENRQWFKSKQGVAIQQTPREYSFCAHAILDPHEIMVVEDARYDERFRDNPFTLGEPHVIFYAGVPVVDGGGQALGTICVIDHRPRKLPEQKAMAMKALAKLVNVHFELRKTSLELERVHQTLRKPPGVNTTPHPVVANRTLSLIPAMDRSLQALLAGKPRPEQSLHLSSIEEALMALKTALIAHR